MGSSEDSAKLASAPRQVPHSELSNVELLYVYYRGVISVVEHVSPAMVRISLDKASQEAQFEQLGEDSGFLITLLRMRQPKSLRC